MIVVECSILELFKAPFLIIEAIFQRHMETSDASLNVFHLKTKKNVRIEPPKALDKR